MPEVPSDNSDAGAEIEEATAEEGMSRKRKAALSAAAAAVLLSAGAAGRFLITRWPKEGED